MPPLFFVIFAFTKLEFASIYVYELKKLVGVGSYIVGVGSYIVGVGANVGFASELKKFVGVGS